MGLGVGNWDSRVLRDYPGAVILDTGFDGLHQVRIYLVCHDGELFFLRYHHSSGNVSRSELNRTHGMTVKCSVEKGKRRA